MNKIIVFISKRLTGRRSESIKCGQFVPKVDLEFLEFLYLKFLNLGNKKFFKFGNFYRKLGF